MKSAFLHSVSEVIGELHDRGFFADCSALMTDSRAVGPQDVFLAVSGQRFDPTSIADEMIEQGRCGLVLVPYDEARNYQSAQIIPVKGLEGMLAELAQQYYDDPSKVLKVIAVTGTNGKTTVTRWLAQALNALGQKAGVVGTLGYGLPDELKVDTGLTTPDAVGIQRVLYQLVREGFKWACLEASSIGLEQGRMDRVQVFAAGYSNLSRDHLDYHGTIEAYVQAKLRLVRSPGLQYAVVNQADAHAHHFGEQAKAQGVRVATFGVSGQTDIHLQNIQQTQFGLSVSLNGLVVETKLVGEFNAYNLALSFGLLRCCGVADDTLLCQALSQATAAPGRMQVVHRQPTVVVDYAHTPDALEQTLLAL